MLGHGTLRPGTLLVAATLLIGSSLLAAGFAGSRFTVPPPPAPAPAFVEATATAPVGRSGRLSLARLYGDTGSVRPGRPLLACRDGRRDRSQGLLPQRDPAVVRNAGTPLMDTLADDPTRAGLQTFTFTVNPMGMDTSVMLSPAAPVEADNRSRLTYVGNTGFFATLERDGGTGPYEITSRVPVYGNGPGQLNEAALRAAGTDYPSEVVALFTAVEPGSLGPNARALEARIIAEANRMPRSTWQIGWSPSSLDGLHVRHRHSRPAVQRPLDRRVLRHVQAGVLPVLRGDDGGHPARHGRSDASLRKDSCPGIREAQAPSQVPMSSAHVWVEVYFPGYGWVAFDPTGGGSQVLLGPLPSGRPTGARPGHPRAPPPRRLQHSRRMVRAPGVCQATRRDDPS